MTEEEDRKPRAYVLSRETLLPLGFVFGIVGIAVLNISMLKDMEFSIRDVTREVRELKVAIDGGRFVAVHDFRAWLRVLRATNGDLSVPRLDIEDEGDD